MSIDIVDSLVRGILGGRGKKSRNALRFLTGRRGNPLVNPSTLLTAAGVAWGIFETLQQKGSDTAGAAPAGAPATGNAGNPGGHVVPPPIPGSAAAAAPVSDDVLRLVRLAVSAAHADGVMTEAERAAVTQQAKAAGASALTAVEIDRPQPLAEIVAGVADPAHRATLYVLAFTILRADEQITGAERIHLAQLANLLELEPSLVQTLEGDTGRRIDALGDQGQLGG